MQTISTDITEQKAAVEAIERFVGALEFIPQGIALWDSENRLIYHNEQYPIILGPEEEHMVPSVDLAHILRMVEAAETIDEVIWPGEDFGG